MDILFKYIIPISAFFCKYFFIKYLKKTTHPSDNYFMASIMFWVRTNELLKSLKMSQIDLASKAGISINTIRGWSHKGLFPNAYESVKIAEILGTTVEYLVTGKDIKPTISPFSEDLPQYDWLTDKRKSAVIEFYKFQVHEQDKEFTEISGKQMA